MTEDQTSPAEPPAPPAERSREPFHLGLLARLRAYFLAGVLVTAPVAITFYIVWLIVSFIDSRVSGLIPERYNPETYLPFGIPGLGAITVEAIHGNDFATLRTMVYIGALLFITGQVLTDVSYTLVDPRVRLG